MLAGTVDLIKISADLRRIRFLSCQIDISDDRVHRGADIMRHIKQEPALGKAAFHRMDLFPFGRFVFRTDDILHIQHHSKAHEYDCNKDEAAPGKSLLHLVCVFSGDKQLCHPHECGIDQQGKQNNARCGYAAVFRERTPDDSPPVEHKAKKAPERKKQESLAAHRLPSRQAWNKLNNDKDCRQDRPDHPRYSRFFVSFSPCQLPGCGRRISETDDRAKGCKIHKPVQRISAEQRKQDGQHHNKHDTVGCF